MSITPSRQLVWKLLREIKNTYNGPVVSISSQSRQVAEIKTFSQAPIVKYVLREFRYNQWTDAQKCAREDEARYMADTYLDYLSSVKQQLVLVEKYKSSEKTTREAAHIVGLELPIQPDVPS